MNSRGVAEQAPGAARRRRADPLLRGERPGRGLRGPGRLRPRRLRGPAADGRHDGAPRAASGPRSTPRRRPQAGRAQGPPRALAAGRRQAQGRRGRGGRADPGPLRRHGGQPAARPRRSGAPGWSRASRWPSTPGMVDERALFLGQWGLRGAKGGSGPSYEELVETEGRPRLRYWLDRLSTEGVLAHAARGLRLLPGGVRGRRAGGARREPRPGRRRSGSGSSSPASAATGTCAWPTSGGRGSWPSSAARSTCCRCTW